MRITLIGMAGAGKSFIGKRIAEEFKLRFVDVDREMERMYEKPLQEQLVELRDEGFIKREEEWILKNTTEDNLVISPGGSVIYCPTAMKYLSSTSVIVFLDVDFDVIRSRIEAETRGIVGLNGRTLRDVYEERLPLYRKYAHIHVDTRRLSADEIVERIRSKALVITPRGV